MQENSGTRCLAAIVFTDVAGFSRIAGLNEERALELLGRDFALMRKTCEMHTGRVISVMGDGLMMMFPSAVEAMQCALEIQTELGRRSAGCGPDDCLHHRIGVHVGDVVLDGDNVYGDGVNVASRLQAEARPDSICFSRTVYDVIKNKVPVTATYLGPRTLRNIPERIMVWQTLPRQSQQGQSPTDYLPMTQPDSGASGMKGTIFLALSIALLGFFIVGAIVFVPMMGQSDDSQIVIPKKKKKPPHPKPESELKRQLDALRPRYAFLEMAASVANAPSGTVPDGPALYQRYQALDDMRKWLDEQLSAVTVDSPIHANIDLGGGELPCTVYTGQGGLMVDAGTNPLRKSLWSLPARSIYNLLAAAAQSPQAPSMASQWADLFAQEYGVGR